MFFYTILTLFLLFLITQNVILLNEETLILICFCAFCWLSVQNLGNSFAKFFDDRSSKIENEINDSVNSVITQLEQAINLKIQFLNVFNEFKLISINTLKFIDVFSGLLTNYKVNLNRTSFPKRLIFISRLEKQTSRLLTLLIIQKLKKVIELKQFCSETLGVPYFKCTSRIAIREYIRIIEK